MNSLKVEDILKVCNGELLAGSEDIEISDFSKDTRQINKGDLYVAIKGESIDGNDFAEDALEKGAIGCLVDGIIDDDILKKYNDRAIIKVEDSIKAIQKIAGYKRSLYDIPVIAITGSVGKTSTKDVIANVLSKEFKVLKTEGNFNNHIGLPFTLLRLKDHTAVVVEMGMNHFGEISVLTNIAKPTACVITNIGTAHIGILGSRENILKAKLEILEGLKENGPVIINNDNDLLHKWYLENKEKYNIYTYGIENESNYLASDINEENDETTYYINGNLAKNPMPGIHFVYNALSAYAVGDILGINKEKIVEGIKDFKLTAKRMDIKTIKNDIKVINDSYNASYDSMKAALGIMKLETNRRKIAVLGNMLELGEFSAQLHRKVGEEVVKNDTDILITVGDLAKEIANKARELNMENIYTFDNIEEAANYLKTIMKDNDVILLKASNSMNFGKILEYIV